MKERTEILSSDEYAKLKVLIKQRKRSLWKGIQERQHEKDMEDFHNFPSAEEIVQLDKSDYVKSAKKVIKICNSTGFVITKSNYCLARSYLLTYTLFNNASRPGATANMTIGEFRQALYKDSSYTISVKKHKTGYKGPANIVMTVELYNEVSKYIEFLRNKLEGISNPTNKETVFLYYNGAAMDSSMITSQFSLFWNRALGKKPKDFSKMNPTLVRKYTTSKVHGDFQSLKHDAAQHLCHSLNVAENKYALFDRRNLASNTSSQLRYVQRSSDFSGNKEKKKEESNIIDLFKEEIKKGSVTVADVRKKMSVADGFKGCNTEIKKIVDKVRHEIRKKSIATASIPADQSITSLTTGAISQAVKPVNQVLEVKMKEEEITSSTACNSSPKIYNLRRKNENKNKRKSFETEDLTLFSEKNENENKRKSFETKDLTLFSDDDVDFVAPSPEMVFKRIRKEFSEEDNRLIYKHLSSVIFSDEQIVKKKFTSILTKHPALESLVKKFGVQSLIVKMRTERQKNISL